MHTTGAYQHKADGPRNIRADRQVSSICSNMQFGDVSSFIGSEMGENRQKRRSCLGRVWDAAGAGGVDLQQLWMPAVHASWVCISGHATVVQPGVLTKIAEDNDMSMRHAGARLSMKLVVAAPDRNSSWRSTFSRKLMLVFTPRIWNSYMARCIFWTAWMKVSDFTITCGASRHVSMLQRKNGMQARAGQRHANTNSAGATHALTSTTVSNKFPCGSTL